MKNKRFVQIGAVAGSPFFIKEGEAVLLELKEALNGRSVEAFIGENWISGLPDTQPENKNNNFPRP